MRTAAVALLYTIGALFLGALLSYPLYLFLEPVADIRFHRLVSRMGLLVALLGLPLLVVYLGVASRQALGLGLSARAFIARLSAGWLLGVLILLPVAAVLVGLDVRVPAPEALHWEEQVLRVAGRAALGGLLIALTEEILFRGALYGAIVRRHSPVQAIVLSSLLYAVLHFVKPLPVQQEGLYWASGVVSLGQGLAQLTDFGRMVDSFLALFAAGVLLALVRRYSGHLAYCVGLHAGWVMTIKTTRHFTDRSADSTLAYLAGSYDGVIGYLAAAWIGVLCLGYGVVVKYWGKRVGGRR